MQPLLRQVQSEARAQVTKFCVGGRTHTADGVAKQSGERDTNILSRDKGGKAKGVTNSGPSPSRAGAEGKGDHTEGKSKSKGKGNHSNNDHSPRRETKWGHMRQDCPKHDLDGARQDEQQVLRVRSDTCEQLRDVYNTQSSDDGDLHDEDSDGWKFVAPLVVAVLGCNRSGGIILGGPERQVL